MTKIIKANGEQEQFKPNKLTKSLRRAGADKVLARSIADEITKHVHTGQTTGDIYRKAFSMLKRKRQHIPAARYTLKRSIQELGPTGFPFEQFIARLYEAYGYRCQVGVTLQGKCVPHEIDVIAHKGKTTLLIEAKFRNRPGDTISVQVPLYMKSRFDDVLAGQNPVTRKTHRCLIITNTAFSKDAMHYTDCMRGMELIAWSYPAGTGLEHLIETKGLHPVTVLTTLTKAEKELLLENGFIICKDIKEKQHQLLSLGLPEHKVQRITQQAGQLCGLSLS